ncbi:MAG: conserved rane protein of unknown function, partial [Hyphomicrobiales bacterium]|nr:conserved rane protein of unknown function [Hyphomicrobiales bacterium]
ARAATGMVIVALGLLVARHVLRIMAGARISLAAAASFFTVVPLALGAAALLFQAGLFDQFVDRIANDSGSAQVRVLMFDLFKGMSWDAFLFGSNIQQISTQQYMNGFEYGIESFWIASVIMQGLVMSMVLWAGLFLFFADLVRTTSMRTLWPLTLAIGIASTSLSLGGKTLMLTFLVSFVVLFLKGPVRIQNG